MKSLKFIFVFLFFISLNNINAQEYEWSHFEDLIENKNRPNQAQLWLYKKLNHATENRDYYSIVRVFNDFSKTTTAMEQEDRTKLFFKLDSLSNELPSASRVMVKTILWEQMMRRLWLPRNFMAKPIQFHTKQIFIRNNRENLEFCKKQLDDLNNEKGKLKYIRLDDKFQYFFGENMEIQSAYDFVCYRLIFIFQDFEHELSGDKYIDDDEVNSNWLKTPLEFTKLSFEEKSITHEILNLFKELETFHTTSRSRLSQAHYLRLEYLLSIFNESEMSQAYLDGFNFYKSSKERSKFMFEHAKIMFDKSKTYHFKHFPENEELAKDALSLLKVELDSFPENEFNEKINALKSWIEKPELSAKTLNHIYTGELIPLAIDGKNIDSVNVWVIKTDLTNFETHKWSELIKSDSIEIVYEEKFHLLNKNLFQKRRNEFLLPSLKENSKYSILIFPGDVSKDSLKNNYSDIPKSKTNFNVSQLFLSFNNNSESKEFILTNLKSGEPIKNAKFEVYAHRKIGVLDNIPVAKGKSNENGVFTAKLEDYNRFTVKVSHKGEKLSSEFYNYNRYRSNNKRKSASILTDREIFRPGQELNFKVVAYEGRSNEFEVLKNTNLKVVFYDANSQKVKELEMKTNDFGSLSGAIDIPEMGKMGNHRLTVHFKDGILGSKNIKVEEYKRPTFEVELKKPSGVAKLGETVEFSGNAKAYAGYPINNARVDYKIERSPVFRWHWHSFNNPVNPTTIDFGETITDESGKFDFSFKAIAGSDNQSLYNYTVEVTVVDETGETRSQKKDLVISQTGLVVNYEGPKSFNAAKSDTFSFGVNNVFGEKQAPLNGEILIYKNKPDKRFLKRIWEDGENQKFDKEKWKNQFEYRKFSTYDQEDNRELVKTLKYTSGSKLNSKEVFKSLESGNYQFELLFNVEKDTLKQKFTFEYINNQKDLKVFKPLAVYTENDVAKPGEDVKIQISSGFKNANVFVEIRSGRDKISSEWKKLSPSSLIDFKVKEEHRGGVIFSFTLIKDGVRYHQSKNIDVPFENKKLVIHKNVFRDKLLPGQAEKWSFTLKTKDGEKVEDAEVIASMYDASLDVFQKTNWNLWPYTNNFYYFNWSGSQNQRTNNSSAMKGWDSYFRDSRVIYSGFYYDNPKSNRHLSQVQRLYSPSMARVGGVAEEDVAYETDMEESFDEPNLRSEKRKKEEVSNEEDVDVSSIEIRENFNETAFFLPHIQTNKEGEFLVEFTLPESLTRWNFKTLSHTKDMKIGSLDLSTEVQKKLMITANAPRFYREGDNAVFSARIANLTDDTLKIKNNLIFINPQTEDTIGVEVTPLKTREQVLPNQNTSVSWEVKLENVPNLIAYRVTTVTSGFGDGEQNYIPILSNRAFITESFPFIANGKGKHKFTFDKFKKYKTSSHENASFSLEFTANPIWQVVMAIPYIAEYPYDCSEQIFTRYYANALAYKLLNENSTLKNILEKWKDQSAESFISQLNKNQDLKSILLQETPWVAQAQTEEEERKRLAQLFNLNNVEQNLSKTLKMLAAKQNTDGGFGWFGGNRSNRYITQHIISGFGFLKQMNYSLDSQAEEILKKGLQFLLSEQHKNFTKLKKEEKEDYRISSIDVHWLYSMSFFYDFLNSNQELQDFYDKALQKGWAKLGLQEQALAGVYFKRSKNEDFADNIHKSLLDRSKNVKGVGRFFPENSGGYSWRKDKIGTHALIMTFFKEMNLSDELRNELETWLILNKRSNHWGHTKNTAIATYALLINNAETIKNPESPKIEWGGNEVDIKANEAFDPVLGYFKTTKRGKEIDKSLAEVEIHKKEKNVSYGALYWQYFEDLDKVTKSENASVSVTRDYEVLAGLSKSKENRNPNNFSLGDKIRVNLTIEVKQDLEYVHLKDLRPAAFEPQEQLSMHRSEHGLWFYQSPKDVATHFFIDNLPRGSYRLSYIVHAVNSGEYSAGNTSIQCMYAPEMQAHSDALQIVVD